MAANTIGKRKLPTPEKRLLEMLEGIIYAKVDIIVVNASNLFLIMQDKRCWLRLEPFRMIRQFGTIQR